MWHLHRESLSLVSYTVQEIKAQHTNSGQNGGNAAERLGRYFKIPRIAAC